MVCRQLPLELVDAIIEHLQDDVAALTACCLVCKAWIHPSRKRLFADVDLNDEAAKELVTPSSTPTSQSPIAPHIRRLTLIGVMRLSFWNETFPRLGLLEGLRSLTIATLSHVMDPPSRQTVLNDSSNIVRLHLDGIRFVAFAQLIQIICAFPRLKTLIIAGSILSNPNPDPPDPTFSLPQSLRALELRDCDQTAILRWLLALERMPPLHSLYLHSTNYRRDGDLLLCRFLQALGPSLEQLWLEPDTNQESECSIKLSHNTHLRSLTVKFWSVTQNYQYLSHLLSEIVSCEMEEIVVGLYLGDHWPIIVDWRHVDEILARPQFSKLRALRIHTRLNLSPWLIERLLKCHARGILFVQPLSWKCVQL